MSKSHNPYGDGLASKRIVEFLINQKNMTSKTISVIGLGYIGLPTVTMFASRGMKVIGVDVNQYAVDTINAGQIHIIEPELDKVVKKLLKLGF